MSSARHLPNGSEGIAIDQGWSDESLVVHLSAFISSRRLDKEFVQYLADAAAEENGGQDDDLTEEDEEGAPE